MVCPPEADTGGQVAAVIGAALSSHGVDKAAPGVTAAAIGERIGGVVVERNTNVEPIVCTSLQKTNSSCHSYLAAALIGLAIL